MSDFDSLVRHPGFLIDKQIRSALTAGHLIEEGTWEDDQVRHASYQLRLGDRVEIARASEAGRQKTKELSLVRLVKGKTVELCPGDTALLYSIENLKLPNSVLGFTVARGLLFIESLVPENTYIDPGFSGPLYTTVTNVSNRVVTLAYGTPIARMFLYRLQEPVEKPYRTGAGMGIAQQLDSVPASALPTLDDARRAKHRALLEEIGKIPIGGFHISEALNRQEVKIERHTIFLFLWPVALLFATSNEWLNGVIHSTFFLGVLASLVAWGFSRVVEFVFQRLRDQ